MSHRQLDTTARALVPAGRGILAADESSGTCTTRFEKLGIASTPETRRDYRELLLATPDLGKYISGAILHDETIRQKTADGAPLTGENAYQVRYNKGEFPPVHAFWSLTMYDMPDQLLVANPIERYLINSPMLPNLKLDADGGLTIYVQHNPPAKDKVSNWLPAPAGPFMLVSRLYLPDETVLDGTWKEPAITVRPK